MPPRITKERLQHIFAEIRTGQQLHAEWIVEGWRNVQYAEGRPGAAGRRLGLQHRPGTPPSRVPVNIFHMFYKATAPRLFPRRFRARAEAEDPAYALGAEQIEALLAWNQKVTGFKQESRAVIGNGQFYGRGIFRHGFSQLTGGLPKEVQHAQSAAIKIHDTQTLRTLGAEDISGVMEEARYGANGVQKPESEISSPTRPRLHVNQHIVANRPYSVSVAPEDLVLDWAADFWWQCRWMDHQHYWMKHQLKEYVRRKGLRYDVDKAPTFSFREAWPYLNGPVEAMRGMAWVEKHADYAADVEFVKIHEWMDLEHGLWALLIEGEQERALEVKDWPFPTDDFPYTFIDYSERQGLLYPISDYSFHAQKQDQINLFNGVWTNLMARSKRIIGYNKQLVDGEELKEAKGAQPLSFVGFNQSARDAFNTIDFKDDPMGYISAIQVLQAQSRSEFGTPGDEHGVPSKVDSATEAALLHQKSETKHEWREVITADGLADASMKQSLYLQAGWPIMAAAGAITPERLLTSKPIFRGAPGLDSGGGIVRVNGMSMDEIEADYRWTHEVDMDSRRGREEKAQRLEYIWNVGQQTGRLNNDVIIEKLIDLYDLNIPGILNPKVDDDDPADEHEKMLVGIPAQIDPTEDSRRHLAKHVALYEPAVKLRDTLMQGQNVDMQNVRPLVRAFATTPGALELLGQHIMETQDRLKTGSGATGGKSMQDRAVDMNQARSGRAKQDAETQQMRGVPPGNINKAAGKIQSQLGMR